MLRSTIMCCVLAVSEGVECVSWANDGTTSTEDPTTVVLTVPHALTAMSSSCDNVKKKQRHISYSYESWSTKTRVQKWRGIGRAGRALQGFYPGQKKERNTKGIPLLSIGLANRGGCLRHYSTTPELSTQRLLGITTSIDSYS